MICLACCASPARALCTACAARLSVSGPRRLAAGTLVRPALAHCGPARVLVHRLKYQGIEQVAGVLGPLMAPLIPAHGTCLVPLPRARARRLRHGIDPAEVLARALNLHCGLPVVAALAPAWWWPAHAGRNSSGRTGARFRVRRSVQPGVVLVDDVLTTGATIEAAAAALGSLRVAGAVTATAAV